ncbi:TOX high mobility group box family member 2 isoform X1 [Latimeria chalumnae]|uniref:TOX high mobility group box family member 2 isoform X1 n=1 Tax=Latimeria chalumnae TaxID=7897 RepID=UPI0003C13C52|nr:PREDICTED: TOX high mobility group box family member 2 isoform X3 [Latimeria chalumnae]|eukprot:XP_006001936.1 PREDICTED: TOX high mobility group box family member 2 isoform X3 [Latimeria chalumnae]
MDVRFYPAATPAAVGSRPADPSCLPPGDYYHCNKNPRMMAVPLNLMEEMLWKKFDGESMYMGMSENNQEFLLANQTYSGESNEDYEIPPITPPNLPDTSLLHLVDHETGYHSLCHSLPHNGLLPPYSYQNMDLPALMVSNMLNQEGHLLSGHLPTISAEKRPSTDMGKKPKTQKKKKKKDPNEPQKPVSAYALFFRDTQAAIKGQNPNATFGDVSKIVASMWDSLGEEQKQAYKKRTEAAKKEYLKALAAYRASLVSKSYSEQVEPKTAHSSHPSHMFPAKQPLYNVQPPTSSPYPYLPSSEMQSYHGSPHTGLTRTLTSKQMLSNLSASPPPSFQISPPLHQQLALCHPPNSLMNQPMNLQHVPQQSVMSHQMSLQVQPPMSSPPGQQNFSHIQSEFQSSSQSPGPSNPPISTSDWDEDYCNRECGVNHCSMIPRDKSLYLT